MADSLSQRDELALCTLALLERTTLAEQRRQALRACAAQARQDEGVAEIVRPMLASRRQRENCAGVMSCVGSVQAAPGDLPAIQRRVPAGHVNLGRTMGRQPLGSLAASAGPLREQLLAGRIHRAYTLGYECAADTAGAAEA